MKKINLKNKLFFLIIAFQLNAQTLSPVVINSAGRTTTVSSLIGTIFYSDNVGETFISSISNGSLILTQGFLQPEWNKAPTLSYTIAHVSCLDKRDGTIKIEVLNAKPGSTITTQWYPVQLCPSQNCFYFDTLSSGIFSVLVSVNDGYSVYPLQSVFQINDSQEPCLIKIFNGISLSGNYPFLYIENIEQYPDNSISIYSRWGNHLATIEGYNNKDKRWPLNKNYMPGTYYYILTLTKGGKPIKGWVELLE